MAKNAKKEITRRITYRLYVIGYTPEALFSLAKKHPFLRAGAENILVYTAGKAPENSTEITEGRLKYLSQAERDWLECCNLQILKKDAMDRREEIYAEMEKRFDRLKEEILSEPDA